MASEHCLGGNGQEGRTYLDKTRRFASIAFDIGCGSSASTFMSSSALILVLRNFVCRFSMPSISSSRASIAACSPEIRCISVEVDAALFIIIAISVSKMTYLESSESTHGEDSVLALRSCWSYSSRTDNWDTRRLGRLVAIKPGGMAIFFLVGEWEGDDDVGDRGLIGR